MNFSLTGIKIMTLSNLKREMNSDPKPHLLHVLPAEAFAESHIIGSFNACIYEIDFLQKVQAFPWKTSDLIVVYGQSQDTNESITAAERLSKAGYQQVAIFLGGIEEIEQQATELIYRGSEPAPFNPLTPHGYFLIDTERSEITWLGKSWFSHHSGRLKIATGQLSFVEGLLRGANGVIDFDSLVCTDITDPMMNQLLLDHLKSEDFFHTELYPTIEFDVDRVRFLNPPFSGWPNYQVEGTISMRGCTRPVQFEATAFNEGASIAVQAQIRIDRTEWGITYGSNRFYARLGKHFVADHINLHLKLIAHRID
jgi:polyisoprenoid-binding protein YceI/rhodanese-related sulfurtransferase